MHVYKCVTWIPRRLLAENQVTAKSCSAERKTKTRGPFIGGSKAPRFTLPKIIQDPRTTLIWDLKHSLSDFWNNNLSKHEEISTEFESF